MLYKFMFDIDIEHRSMPVTI